MRVTVECGWSLVGEVGLSAGELEMPDLPDAPGVYQWIFRHDGRERRYVGEAGSLRQRFRSYARRQPAGTNQRMQDRAKRVLAHGGTVHLVVASDVRIVRTGASDRADLSSKHVRRLVEDASLIEVLAELGELVNDVGYGELKDDPILG